jgi:hypothetical protein
VHQLSIFRSTPIHRRLQKLIWKGQCKMMIVQKRGKSKINKHINSGGKSKEIFQNQQELQLQ